MTSGVSNPFSTYSASGHCSLQTRDRYQIGPKIGGPLPSGFSSFISLQHPKHRQCLRIARRRPTVVCIHNYKSTPAHVTQSSWEESVLKNESAVLVEFYASWCGPCQMVHRVIEEIAAEYKGKLDCYVLDTDLDLPLAEEYEVKAVPVVLLFKNGRKCDCIVGTMPKEFYVAAIDKVLVS